MITVSPLRDLRVRAVGSVDVLTFVRPLGRSVLTPAADSLPAQAVVSSLTHADYTFGVATVWTTILPSRRTKVSLPNGTASVLHVKNATSSSTSKT